MKYNLSDVAVLVIGICFLFVGLQQSVDSVGLLWLAMIAIGSFGIGVFVCSGQEDSHE
jgi:hypothetical protein